MAIEAETEAGESHTRLWRDEGALSAAALAAERARWQLDGWVHWSARRAAASTVAPWSRHVPHLRAVGG
ncbi:MAG: hypothetical protein R2710_17255 [Acidimicrobiales bacterium]